MLASGRSGQPEKQINRSIHTDFLVLLPLDWDVNGEHEYRVLQERFSVSYNEVYMLLEVIGRHWGAVAFEKMVK